MAVPFFFGASCRKRARELLGCEVGLEPPTPMAREPVRPRIVPPPVRVTAKGADLVRRFQPPQSPITPRPPPGRPPQQRAPPAQSTVDGAEVKWVDLADSNSELLEQGYPSEAPVIEWTKELQASGVLSGIGAITMQLAGDASVELRHDVEWTEFPEVCEALRALDVSEVSYCIAFCPDKSRWGVGLGGKWKNREATAKLALSVLLAQETDTPSNEPHFRQFCDAAGVPLPRDEPVEPVARRAVNLRPARSAEGSQPPRYAPQATDVIPRDTPLWLTLPEDENVPEVIKGLMADTVVVATESQRRREVYSQAEVALQMFTGDNKEAIKYLDDSNWENFPIVGTALKAIAPKEECMTVALCDAQSVWAVGVGMRRKNRDAAAKVALATALALQAEDAGEEVDFSEMEAFETFVQEAREAREEFTDAT